MKRGFTLIELLAVIVILAIIALIAVPIVINIIEDAKKSSQEESFKLYAKAVENAITKYLMKHPTVKPETLTMEEIKDYIKYSGEKIECSNTKIYSNGKIYLSDCTVDSKKVEYTYGEKQRDPNITVDLTQGLIPVIYDGNNWKIVDKNDSKWYDYDEQRWANAVVLKRGLTKNIGDIITVEGEDPDVLMMLVWIPRYEYKIEGAYGKHPDGTEGTQDLPGEIKVNFISKNATRPTEGYHINNAFTFDGEKSGFWVGKFELSHSDQTKSETSLNCTTTSCDEAQNLRILPNVSSLRFNSVSNFWYGMKSIENKQNVFGLTEMDTHMMKNSEWGAVAYLSQSKYGKYGNKDYEGAQKEIYDNNSSGYYTGRSGGNIPGNTPTNETYPNESVTYQGNTYGYYTYDGYLLSYKTNTKSETRDINKGAGASTTGNIYGVYDMSGGALEFIMGVFGYDNGIYIGHNVNDNSGFNGMLGASNTFFTNGVEVPDSKYYDKYVYNNGILLCNNGACYGHTISETSGWYNDKNKMIYAASPWFLRGGFNSSGSSSGIFSYTYSSGAKNYYVYSSRFACIKK